VVSLDPGGARRFTQRLGDGATVTGVGASASGIAVLARFEGPVTVAGATLTPPSGADHGWLLAGLAPGGAPRWAVALGGPVDTGVAGVEARLAVGGDGRIAVATGAGGCGATIAAYDADGRQLWSRAVARGGCDGQALVLNGLAVTRDDRVVAGGALSADVDLGRGPLSVQRTDGFLAELGP
jgi:outer membrane protein assembly factor BamB